MIPLLLALAAFHVPVTCDMAVPAPPNQAAQGVYQDGRIQLRPFICDALDEGRSDWNQFEATSSALALLVHELAHSYGIHNEAGAECVGAFLTGYVARHIGYHQTPLLDAAYRRAVLLAAPFCKRWDAQGDPSA